MTGKQENTTPMSIQPASPQAEVTFLELEITNRCGLRCVHCYAESGPTGTHGAMTPGDWESVIGQAAALGVGTVQVIGGEPTAHPNFVDLVEYAISVGLKVEVFSNLTTVRTSWWDLFTRLGVSLATSYYSDRAIWHERVTGRRGSHARTRANIAEAIRRGIPLRVGIIDVLDGQRVERARADLKALGVTDVGVDRVRGVGRGASGAPSVGELCGQCGRGAAAISADGDVRPCVLSGWMGSAGNVKHAGLGEILNSAEMRKLVAAIPSPRGAHPCSPDKAGCKPKTGDGADCHPAEKPACRPKFR